MRTDGRRPDEIRPVVITPGYSKYAEGSALIEMGSTQVLCNATVDEHIPYWLRGQNQGWVTAEYALLPRATQERTSRETSGLTGRTQEIRRLIGRSLRAGVDLVGLGERTIIIDCDVIQADGSTRCAAITGGYVALALALRDLIDANRVSRRVIRSQIAAVSVGVVDSEPMLDLAYAEDVSADVDLNVVMTSRGEYVEIQGTAEGTPFDRAMLDQLLGLAQKGIEDLLLCQRHILHHGRTATS